MVGERHLAQTPEKDRIPKLWVLAIIVASLIIAAAFTAGIWSTYMVVSGKAGLTDTRRVPERLDNE